MNLEAKQRACLALRFEIFLIRKFATRSCLMCTRSRLFKTNSHSLKACLQSLTSFPDVYFSAGESVASLSVHFNTTAILRKDPSVRLSYKLLAETSAKHALSEIPLGKQPWVILDSRTGDLKLNRKIDREVECARKQFSCEQKLQVNWRGSDSGEVLVFNYQVVCDL